MIGRWLARLARRDRAVSRPDGSLSTPVELRVHLPLLWPAGPDGPVDHDALRALGSDYARSGRTMEELLADLDILCSVVGIGASSRMIEASSVAWSDAYLDAVAAGSPPDASRGPTPDSGGEGVVEEVARRLAAFRASPWSDLAPTGSVLLVTWPPGSGSEHLADELARVVEEVRRTFPDAVVAQQPQRRRVVAAVAHRPTTTAHVSVLRARCADLVAGAVPTVTLVDAPADDLAAQHLLRPAQ